MVAKSKSKLADTYDVPQLGDAQAHIPDPTGGATTDAEARAAIVLINAVLEYHGLVKTS